METAEEQAAAEIHEDDFTRSFGLTDDARPLALVMGRGGHLLIAGSAKHPQDIGAGLPVTPEADAASAFLLGFGPGGEPRYSQFFPGAAFGAVAVDDAGGALLTGGQRRGATFAEFSSNEAGAYVTRVDPVGHVRWTQLFRGSHAEGHAIAVDAAGGALVGGVFSDNLTVGSERLTGAENVFLTRLRPSGEVAWAKSFWGEAPQDLRRIALGPGGRAVIAGTFSDRMGLDVTRLLSNGGTDVFLGVIEPDGQVAWAWGYGGPGDDDAPQLAIAPDGSILLAGTFRGRIDLGTGALTAYRARRVYVARFDPDGRPRWAVPFTPTGEPVLAAIAVEPNGSIVVSGARFDAIGGGQGLEPGPFLATLDGEGHLLRFEMLPADGGAEITGLAVDPSGSMILAGHFTRSIALGGRLLPSTSSADQQSNLFLARLSPSAEAR
jgi:hypothetical protein